VTAQETEEEAMVDIDEHGRTEPPIGGGEVESIRGFLDYQRATLAWKCSGLDSEGLNMRIAASSMTLGGLLKHMAYVEDAWFSQWLFDRPKSPPWDSVDWKADQDWEWRSAAEDSSKDLFSLWREAIVRSDALLDQALAEGGLDQPGQRTWPDGRAPNVRWMLLHMIEEYARHNGHADLLREAVDGETGE
jgi:uncharacterized damage-inducible protein DinB